MTTHIERREFALGFVMYCGLVVVTGAEGAITWPAGVDFYGHELAAKAACDPSVCQRCLINWAKPIQETGVVKICV